MSNVTPDQVRRAAELRTSLCTALENWCRDNDVTANELVIHTLLSAQRILLTVGKTVEEIQDISTRMLSLAVQTMDADPAAYVNTRDVGAKA